MFYLIAMLLVVVFAPPFFVRWLGRQLGMGRVTLASNYWLIAAGLVQLIAVIIHTTNQNIATNFILHAVGGGVVVSILFAYTLRSLKLRCNWQITLLLLFAAVSMLGVLNEIAEFVLDLLGFGQFSLDRMDTWRDMVANTVGALAGWALIKLIIVKK